MLEAAEGARQRVVRANATPAGGTTLTAAPANPIVTMLGGVQQHTSDLSSSAIARRAGATQALDQVFVDLGDVFADPLRVDLAEARLR
jgi:hypothetical protein